jgi:hypothetical protein
MNLNAFEMGLLMVVSGLVEEGLENDFIYHWKDGT